MEKAALKVARSGGDDFPDFESLLKSDDFQQRLEQARVQRERNLAQQGAAPGSDLDLSTLRKPWEIQARRLERPVSRMRPLVLEKAVPEAPPAFTVPREAERPPPTAKAAPLAKAEPATLPLVVAEVAAPVAAAPVVVPEPRPVILAVARPLAGFVIGAGLGVGLTWLYWSAPLEAPPAGLAAAAIDAPAELVATAEPMTSGVAPAAPESIAFAALPLLVSVAPEATDRLAVKPAALPQMPAVATELTTPAAPLADALDPLGVLPADGVARVSLPALAEAATVPDQQPTALEGPATRPEMALALTPRAVAELPASDQTVVAAGPDADPSRSTAGLPPQHQSDALPTISAADATAPGVAVFVFAPVGHETGQVGAEIRAAGFRLAVSNEVELGVRENHVRYYHADDRAAALTLAVALGVGARDFTEFRPAPLPGHVEVWLAGARETAPTKVTTAPAKKPKVTGETKAKPAKVAAKAAKKKASAGLTEQEEMQRLRDSILWQLRNPDQ